MSHSFSLRFLILVSLVFGSFGGFGGFRGGINGVDALVTLDSIRSLTVFTAELREGIHQSIISGDVRFGGVRGQLVFDYRVRDGDEKGDEEDESEGDGLNDIAIKIQALCDKMKKILDIPLSGERNGSLVECEVVKKEYHAFMGETVGFLHDVQEAVQIGAGGALKSVRTSDDSVEIHQGIQRLQLIWASRRGNTQNRSFIEQQLECYKEEVPSSCFGKNVVLRHDVEVVEYLNWLLEEVV